jgi:hypothetical protein
MHVNQGGGGRERRDGGGHSPEMNSVTSAALSPSEMASGPVKDADRPTVKLKESRLPNRSTTGPALPCAYCKGRKDSLRLKMTAPALRGVMKHHVVAPSKSCVLLQKNDEVESGVSVARAPWVLAVTQPAQRAVHL